MIDFRAHAGIGRNGAMLTLDQRSAEVSLGRSSDHAIAYRLSAWTASCHATSRIPSPAAAGVLIVCYRVPAQQAREFSRKADKADGHKWRTMECSTLKKYNADARQMCLLFVFFLLIRGKWRQVHSTLRSSLAEFGLCYSTSGISFALVTLTYYITLTSHVIRAWLTY